MGASYDLQQDAIQELKDNLLDLILDNEIEDEDEIESVLRDDIQELIRDIAGSQTPVYNSDLMDLANDDYDLLTTPSEFGSTEPLDIIRDNVYMKIEEWCWEWIRNDMEDDDDVISCIESVQLALDDEAFHVVDPDGFQPSDEIVDAWIYPKDKPGYIYKTHEEMEAERLAEWRAASVILEEPEDTPCSECDGSEVVEVIVIRTGNHYEVQCPHCFGSGIEPSH